MKDHRNGTEIMQMGWSDAQMQRDARDAGKKVEKNDACSNVLTRLGSRRLCVDKVENSGTTWAHTGATRARDASLTQKSVYGCGWRRRGLKEAYTKIRRTRIGGLTMVSTSRAKDCCCCN